MKNKKTTIFITALGIFAVILIFLNFRKKTNTPQQIKNDLSSLDSLVEKSTSSTLINANVIWQTNLPDTPKVLPVIVNNPDFDQNFISQLSLKLRFSPDQQISKQTKDGYFWINKEEEKSLSVSMNTSRISYKRAFNNQKERGFEQDDEKILNQAKQISNNLFSDYNFIPQARIEFTSFIGQETAGSGKSAAQFATIYFSQSINDVPIIASNESAQILSITLDNSLFLVRADMLGALSSAPTSEDYSLASPNEIKNLNPKDFIRIGSQHEAIDTDIQINASNNSVFYVQKARLVYFSNPSTKQIQPAFLLEGIIEYDQKTASSRYIVSAIKR